MCRAVSACRACVPRYAKYAMPCRAVLARSARVPCRARVPRCENVPCRAEPAYSAASGRARMACLACDPKRDKCALCSPRVPCPRAAPRRACVPRCATGAVPCPRAVPAFQVAQHVPCRSRAVPYLRSRAQKKSRAVHECSAVPAWRAMPASIRKEKICSAWPCPRTVPAYRARAPCHAAPCQRSRMRKIFRAVPRRVRVLCRVVPCQRAVPCLLLNMRKMCSTAPCSLTMPHRAATAFQKATNVRHRTAPRMRSRMHCTGAARLN